MSFNRVLNYLKRNKNQTTFVCVKNGTAQCMAAHDKKTNLIMLGFYADIKPVGFYTSDVDEVDLEQDLIYCGVMEDKRDRSGISNSYLLEKVCNTCHKTLSIGNFHKNHKSKDGHLNKCRECINSDVKRKIFFSVE